MLDIGVMVFRNWDGNKNMLFKYVYIVYLMKFLKYKYIIFKLIVW